MLYAIETYQGDSMDRSNRPSECSLRILWMRLLPKGTG